MLSGITTDALTGTIPEILFVIFQMTFAIITVAIITGSIAERMKFGAFVAFITIWSDGGLRANYPLGMGWWLVSE